MQMKSVETNEGDEKETRFVNRRLTLSEIGLGDLVADDSTGIVDGRIGIELHRLDHILLDDTDLER